MSDLNQAGPNQIREAAEAVVKDKRLELFDFSMRPQGKSLVLTVVLDKETGPVTVEDCAAVSREIESRLDALDAIGTPYLLEVSSPGLDRPLRNLKDCLRFRGRLAQFITKEPVAQQTSFKGRIQEAKNGWVGFLAEDGKYCWLLSFDLVKTARLVVEIK